MQIFPKIRVDRDLLQVYRIEILIFLSQLAKEQVVGRVTGWKLKTISKKAETS
jgi:hypothetical protein